MWMQWILLCFVLWHGMMGLSWRLASTCSSAFVLGAYNALCRGIDGLRVWQYTLILLIFYLLRVLLSSGNLGLIGHSPS